MIPRIVGSAVSLRFSHEVFRNFSRPVTTVVNNISGVDSASLSKARPFEEIPGYRSFPVIGTAWIYFPIIGKYSIHRTHKADFDKYQKFGNIHKDKFGHLYVVSCYSPEDIETVLRNEGKYPNRGKLTTIEAYRKLRKQWYKTPGVMVLQGHEWQDLRSKTQPHIMKPKLVTAFLGPMQNIAQDFVRRVRFLRDGNDEDPDILPELVKWALESIGCVALDTRLGCLGNNLDPSSEPVRLINSVQTMFQCMNKLEPINGNVQWWKFLPSPTWNKFVKVSDYFTEIALKYINRAFEELEKNNDEEKELTLLQCMLRTPGLDISGVMTTSMDLLFGGIDTASHTQGFLLYHLAKNPEKQEKLYEEVKRVLPLPKDKITTAVLNELRYTKACIRESMRLHPIIKGIARTLDHDIVLSGYRVPAGANIFCMLQIANMVEKNYPNASQYIPERWLDKENKPHPYISQPFGIGIRSCIGRRLAEQEMICATVEFVKNFRMEYHGEDLDMITRMIAIPDKPLKLKFIDRFF